MVAISVIKEKLYKVFHDTNDHHEHKVSSSDTYQYIDNNYKEATPYRSNHPDFQQLQHNLRAACEKGNELDFKNLASIVDVADDDSYCLRVAAANGHASIVEALLECPRVDPSANHNEAIRKAAAHGHVQIVQMLLNDPRVDPSDSDIWINRNEAIKNAAEAGYVDVVAELLHDKRVDPSADNDFALRKSAELGHSEIVKVLLQDKRVDPSAGDLWLKNEPIRAASLNGHAEVVEVLLQDPRVDPSAMFEKPIRNMPAGSPPRRSPTPLRRSSGVIKRLVVQ